MQPITTLDRTAAPDRTAASDRAAVPERATGPDLAPASEHAAAPQRTRTSARSRTAVSRRGSEHRATQRRPRSWRPAPTRPAGAAVAVHPALADRTTFDVPTASGASGLTTIDAEDGSLVTEYGLLAVVAATIAGVIISWASGGALVTLFNALLRQARSLVGA